MSGAPAKKLALSAAVIAASGAYVWSQVGTMSPSPADAGRSVASSVAPAATPEPANPAALPEPAVVAEKPAVWHPQPPELAQSEPSGPSEATPPPAASASTGATAGGADSIHAAWASSHMTMFGMVGMGFSDGTYRGPVVDAYYGVVQVQAIIKHGRLDSVDVLRWPADRDTSVAINEHALPLLRDEAISAQSADVDIVSGATLLSDAFIELLGAALKQARA